MPEAIPKSADRIAGMFDAIAARYDFLNHLLSLGIDRAWRRRAIRALALTGSEQVLDLCTGTADLALAARRATPPAARVVGLDFAVGMLAVAKGKLRHDRLGETVALVRGDATRAPFVDRSFDAATIAFGIRNVENPRRACDEIYRVLKPGGRLAILEFATPRAPGIRRAYRWYFSRLLPRIGELVSRHASAYAYLPASVDAFAAPDEFVTILRQSGLEAVRATPLTFGIVYLYVAKRPSWPISGETAAEPAETGGRGGLGPRCLTL